MFIEKDNFEKINRAFPLNAVELVILNTENKVLMVKRTNQPAIGQWWIPGGRVLFAEEKNDAANRLLNAECGIATDDITELEMFEYLVKDSINNHYQHTISTVYLVKITENDIKIDSQSSEYAWKHPEEWEGLTEHNFLKQLLSNLQGNSQNFSFTKEIGVQRKTKFIDDKLYAFILKSLPIPCVDILIRNKAGEILLVKRKNEPAKDKWWVPGGRVLHGEKRIDTAARKLIEECGLEGTDFKNIGNFEFIFKNSNNTIYHNIATLFEVIVKQEKVVLDTQSSEFSWRSPSAWLELPLDVFIRDIIENKADVGRGKIYH